jgi:hypothetical protein
MKASFKFTALILLFALSACNNHSSKESTLAASDHSDCKPYFNYDKVEHYFLNIDESELWKINEKKKRSADENQQLELLIQRIPDTLSDTAALLNIERIGFVRKEIPKSEFQKLDQIFCERKHKESISTACIAIYRDILVFRMHNEIVGTAKICFGCWKHVIAGTKQNTKDFGQSGDYSRLFRILHKGEQFPDE